MRNRDLSYILGKSPNAYATIKGSSEYPQIIGNTSFYQTPFGIMVVTSVTALPKRKGECDNRIFAIHIHSGGECTGNAQDELANTGTHYNPNNCPHPHHAGDMPPLFSADGYAFSAYLTNKFVIGEIVGKTVVIHENLDDFTTQPAGNAGKKIACGVIVK